MPVYEITNIADYLAGNNFAAYKDNDEPDPDKEGTRAVTLSKIPNVLPPFPEFWMEFRHSQSDWSIVEDHHETVGLHIFASKIPEGGWEWRVEMMGRDDELQDFLLPRGRGCGTQTARTDQQGNPLPGSLACSDGQSLWTPALVGLIAISFLNLHPNSVQIVANPPSRQLRRHAQRQGTVPPPTFKMILIRGMKPRGSANGPSSSAGGYSLHLVKGYMMTVLPTKPLFGCALCLSGEGHKPDRRRSHVGTFWIEGHTRGDISQGDTTKTPFKVKVGDGL